VKKVAEIAEAEKHHPDIFIFYNVVRLDLWTHSVNGLSENDFIVAAKIDALTAK
jgi:4a-hydroxytetrahydrobiopterin dehydratase